MKAWISLLYFVVEAVVSIQVLAGGQGEQGLLANLV